MRTAFIQELIIQARLHPEIFLVVGDLGFSVVEPFAKEFPNRFLNAGVAEQNMTGVAAGLASEGYHVFTYSIANFPTLRCLEQIRNDVCYHRLPVTVVAVGGGLAYGNLGYSHHAVQDLAIMRTLPGIRVLAPGDPGETTQCVQWLATNPGPSYLRIGKAGEKTLHALQGIAQGPLLIHPAPTAKLAIISTGDILNEALSAALTLEQQGHAVAVFSMPFLKPIQKAQLLPLMTFQHIVAVEEHGAEGGLASALREHLPSFLTVHSISISDETAVWVGGRSFLREKAGISSSSIAAYCTRLLAPN